MAVVLDTRESSDTSLESKDDSLAALVESLGERKGHVAERVETGTTRCSGDSQEQDSWDAHPFSIEDLFQSAMGDPSRAYSFDDLPSFRTEATRPAWTLREDPEHEEVDALFVQVLGRVERELEPASAPEPVSLPDAEAPWKNRLKLMAARTSAAVQAVGGTVEQAEPAARRSPMTAASSALGGLLRAPLSALARKGSRSASSPAVEFDAWVVPAAANAAEAKATGSRSTWAGPTLGKFLAR